MDAETRCRVKEFLKRFVCQTLERARCKGISLDKAHLEYPFHTLFFRDEAILAFMMQRSIVTRMGQRLYPELARLIGQARHPGLSLDFLLRVSLPEPVWATVGAIVDDLRHARRKPDHSEEIREVLSSASRVGPTTERTIVLDIFIPLPRPTFVELKSLRPNLDVCAETKRKILTFEAFLRMGKGTILVAGGELPLPQEEARGFLGLYYGLRDSYTHSFTERIMDMEAEVLIGPELWDFLGGPGAFEELRRIIEEVKEEITLSSPIENIA